MVTYLYFVQLQQTVTLAPHRGTKHSSTVDYLGGVNIFLYCLTLINQIEKSNTKATPGYLEHVGYLINRVQTTNIR